ncbi:helix-turn-helix domain-containing protein [Bartonella heixiaziensis]|uniref:helix-turn-helix domain-containing protein n=1 Tax=Bartonella heixiaziensis TaxID=1461000 RepID=UPI003D1AED8D
MTTKNPDFNDIFIGKKIRFQRTMLGMSQKQLGSRLGVTFQQIQKYEKGLNRVSAERLKEIADLLNVPLSFFILISQQKKTLQPMMTKQYRAKKNTSF